MTRESVDEKARRYLGEGRLIVERVVADEIRARCRGGGGAEYVLGLEAGEWWCGCPAHTRCAHLTALQLVTVAAIEPDLRPSLDEETVSRAGFEW